MCRVSSGGGSSGGGSSSGGTAGGATADAGDDAGSSDAGLDAGSGDGGVADAGLDDGGVIDAGGGDAGAEDSGLADASVRDAGRIIRVANFDEYLQANAGLIRYARFPNSTSALFELADGGVLRIPLSGDGGSFRAEGVPGGPWTCEEVTSTSSSFFEVLGDEIDISTLVATGSPGQPFPQPSAVTMALSNLSPWSDVDIVRVFSRGAGNRVELDVSPLATLGSVAITGSAPVQVAFGNQIRAGDDFVVHQVHQVVTDAGNTASLLLRSGRGSGLSIPGDTLSLSLQPTPVRGIQHVSFDTGLVAVALDGLQPSCRVDVYESIGTYFTISDPELAGVEIVQQPDELAVAGTQTDSLATFFSCAAQVRLPIPTADGGLETLPDGGRLLFIANVGMTAVGHSALDGGSVPNPTISAPRFIRVDGQSVAHIVSREPVISWSVPAFGSPSMYRVGLFRLSRSGNSVRSRIVASFFTTRTQVRVPPALLSSGGQYVATVDAEQRPPSTTLRSPRFPKSASGGSSPVFIVP